MFNNSDYTTDYRDRKREDKDAAFSTFITIVTGFSILGYVFAIVVGILLAA